MIEAIDPNSNNQFILHASTITPKEDTANDGVLTLTGMASSNAKSLYGEVMNENALQRMCAEAAGLPILYDHEGKMKSVAGVVTNAYLDDNKLYIDFNILPRFQEEITELLNFGVNLGLSIGGLVSSFDKQNGRVEDISLVEISLTPVPANRDTHGTVMMKQGMVTGDCLYGVCNAIINENLKEDEIISTENNLEEIKRAKPQEGEEGSGEKPQENNEEKNDEPLTREQVKEMMDERFAEEKQSIIETVLNEVKNMLNNKGEEEGEVKQSVKPAQEPVKAKDIAVPMEVQLDADEIAEKVSAKLNGNNIDELVERTTAKVLEGLGKRRDNITTKVEQAVKEEKSKPEEVKQGMTPEEAARMMCHTIENTDPITRAINESLQK